MFTLPKDFILGVATASTQIEGGRVGSNWNDFCERKKTADGSDVARANQHYEKMEEDIALLKRMKIQGYRMSLEWARLEPDEGHFSKEAFEHYRAELQLLKDAGIQPLVTLYHFSHPMWFERKGAFTKKENIPLFLRYVEKCIRELGALCDTYITINEPNIFAVNAYFLGEWPPEKKSMRTALKVMNILIACHCKAYELIHKIRNEQNAANTRVSFAHHAQAFYPRNEKSFFDRKACRVLSFLFQDGLREACFKGVFKFPFKNIGRVEKKKYVDYIAINYYSRQAVHGFSYAPFPNTPKNDLGWNIFPEGIIKVAGDCYQSFPLPIIVTENGTCDAKDAFRSRYIYEHLKAIAESELPFEGYYHWCFIDNFEWKEGESARFGLVHCDYETQKRTIRASGNFYTELIEKHAVDETMMQKYINPCTYPVR